MSAGGVDRGIFLRPGAIVEARGKQYKILHVLSDFDALEVEDTATGDAERISLAELGRKPTIVGASQHSPDLSEPSERDWNEAKRRLEAVKELLALPARKRADVEARAVALGVDAVTVYRWLRIYRDSGKTAALLPSKPSGGRGKKRLDPAVERVIEIAIETVYLKGQQRSVGATALEVQRLCKRSGLIAPHENTVRARIAAIPEHDRLTSRSHKKEAADRFSARPGHFEDAQRPLAIVQIDHTKLDIELVDDQHRLGIGRPWLTLVFDVFSRMVLGFHISLDPPGANGTGLALAHAILPKETWLAKRGINNPWPCFGFPAMVHLDNAREFRGEMLRRACEQYNIELNYRPVATPHFGGHIERSLGTLSRAVHELPGATFSNPKQRGDYDSEGSAALTLAELERYVAEYITGIYHRKLHSRLRMSPLQRWTDAILGSATQPGMGIERPADEERLRIDFLPLEERTVQAYGVQIDKLNYYSDVLRPYINSAARGNKRKFIFRRDPGDISHIYFWDPELKQYSLVPYRDITHPPMSIWELRELRRRLEEDGRKNIDEAAIFEAYDRLERHRDEAIVETKRVRRQRARKATRMKPPTVSPLPSPIDERVVIAFPKRVKAYEVDDV